jgi:hypothetical protein
MSLVAALFISARPPAEQFAAVFRYQARAMTL